MPFRIYIVLHLFTIKIIFFLETNFSEIKYTELIQQNDNVEYWINLLTIDGYFVNDENGNEKASYLANNLAEIWKIKLAHDFPKQKFIVSCIEDKDSGDYGVTFYQQQYQI